jgi:hypothetical protein
MLWALLWALFLSAAEFLVIGPLHSQTLAAFLVWWIGVWSLPLFWLVGCGLLLLARRYEPRNAWLRLVATGLLLAAVAAAWQATQAGWIDRLWAGHGQGRAWLERLGYAQIIVPTPWFGLAAFDFWLSLFYGGLLVTAYVLMVRGERMRSLLRQAAVARSRTEALLDQARLQGLQSQVDPRLLLDTLDEVQALYRHESARADALLDVLVEFLRAALPGLQQRRSTLQAELHLARAYADLQAMLPRGQRWVVDLPAQLPQIRFPSLLLLPILALADRDGSPSLRVGLAEGRLQVDLQGLHRDLPVGLPHHTQASLQDLLGPAARLQTFADSPTRLRIELDLSTPAKEHDDEDRLT